MFNPARVYLAIDTSGVCGKSPHLASDVLTLLCATLPNSLLKIQSVQFAPNFRMVISIDGRIIAASCQSGSSMCYCEDVLTRGGVWLNVTRMVDVPIVDGQAPNPPPYSWIFEWPRVFEQDKQAQKQALAFSLTGQSPSSSARMEFVDESLLAKGIVATYEIVASAPFMTA
jgi:hypothetical protein